MVFLIFPCKAFIMHVHSYYLLTIQYNQQYDITCAVNSKCYLQPSKCSYVRYNQTDVLRNNFSAHAFLRKFNLDFVTNIIMCFTD